MKSRIEQTAVVAKKIIYVLEDTNITQKVEDSSELVNLYTKRINKPSQTLSKKINTNDFRPFEFLVNRN
ncbi:MAG: hypothetical protein R2831_03955 [Chitinophagaceae bacterium]